MLKLITNKTPLGDQEKAIKTLSNNILNNNFKNQVLLGATGTGKTFTIANVINNIQKKTLIVAPNKTLAAQLYMEFKDLFPENKVEYFVSYFDFYQPEAYVVKTDTYIEKSSKTNQEIEMMRLSTLNSLSHSNDVIVVASVAAIYASTSPYEFKNNQLIIDQNTKLDDLKSNLIRLNYARNEINLEPGTFRNKGDVVEIAPGYTDKYFYQLSFFGEDLESIWQIDSLKRTKIKQHNLIAISSAKEYISSNDKQSKSIKLILEELNERIKFFKENNKLIEAQRIEEKTNRDVEALIEYGYCNGIENYSRHLEFREKGETPFTILDYFGDDWLIVLDESHLMIPQIQGMYNTDYSRKSNLVEYGFRLPSALDNRPLKFDEFLSKLKYTIFVSATPNEYELELSDSIVEQIVRPTGLLDPIIYLKPSENQIVEIFKIIKENISRNERTLITVLTIKLAEELSSFLLENNIKSSFLHNEIKTIDRYIIINDLRRGKYDVLIGINLLREGLDIPEVSTVIIVDADKPGFFRSDKSLIQTIGRASRNANGKVYMFGDTVTKAMKKAINETNRRRTIQSEYNIKNNVVPQTISKTINDELSKNKNITMNYKSNKEFKSISKNDKQLIRNLKAKMKRAANNQEYELAAEIRDIIYEIENKK